MRFPRSLEPLADQGIIDEVVRPLLAGKEAEVYLVIASGEPRVAKVYKEARHRSFKHRAAYTEGRRGRNSRRERAMAKRSRYGREEEEAAWRSAEVDAIYRLHWAGVRVPKPYDFVDGVLIMEMIADEEGHPAPRLVDVELTEEQAVALFHHLLREVVKMLCAGLVHGDLSDFNVLLGVDGPVLIDFPQAIDAAANQNARRMLIRDVDNLQQFLARWAPHLKAKQYGQEMWALYERGRLTPETELTGKVRGRRGPVDTRRVLDEIEAAERDAQRRGLAPEKGRPEHARAERDEAGEADERPSRRRREGGRGEGGRREDRREEGRDRDSGRENEGGRDSEARPRGEGRGRRREVHEVAPSGRHEAAGGSSGAEGAEAGGGAKRKRRRRRRRKGGGEGASGNDAPRAPAERTSRARPSSEGEGSQSADLPDDLDRLLLIED